MCPWDTDATDGTRTLLPNWYSELSLTKGNNFLKHGAIYTIIKLEENIMVLNNVTKFHRILIKTIRPREHTLFKTVIFHKQRALTDESRVRYGPLLNLKKTSWY